MGRPGFTDERVANIKAKLLVLIPQGWTIREMLAEPDMCSMSYLFRELLPNDEATALDCQTKEIST